MEKASTSDTSLVLACSQISKQYNDGEGIVKVLDSIDFSVSSSERIAIVGSSGSGKSSLLHILGGLDSPSRGEVFINGMSLSTANLQQQAKIRNQHLGFVYQFHHLLNEFNALENVTMPLRIAGMAIAQANVLAQQALQLVGLEHRGGHKPNALSGGERQRVAIARAIVNKPDVLLADEPTGNLDAKTGEQIYQLLLSVQEQTGMALVVVTHDLNLASRMQRILTLKNGKLVAS